MDLDLCGLKLLGQENRLQQSHKPLTKRRQKDRQHNRALKMSLFNEDLDQPILRFSPYSPPSSSSSSSLFTQMRGTDKSVIHTRWLPSSPERILDAPDFCNDF